MDVTTPGFHYWPPTAASLDASVFGAGSDLTNWQCGPPVSGKVMSACQIGYHLYSQVCCWHQTQRVVCLLLMRVVPTEPNRTKPNQTSPILKTTPTAARTGNHGMHLRLTAASTGKVAGVDDLVPSFVNRPSFSSSGDHIHGWPSFPDWAPLSCDFVVH